MCASLAVESKSGGTCSAILSLGLQGVEQVQIRKGDELVLQHFLGGRCGLSPGWIVIQRPPAVP